MRSLSLWRLIKYGLTGVLNTAVSYVAYTLLVLAHVEVHWSVAIGYVVGMITSYLVNSTWTFEHRVNWKTAFAFLVVNLVVLAISEGTLTLILHLVSSSPYIAQAINLVPTVLVGFVLNQWIVFRNGSKSVADESHT